MLPPEQERYVSHRTSLQKIWPWAAGFMAVIWAGGLAALFWRLPLLANPFLMIEKLEAGELTEASLTVFTAMAPLLMHGAIFLLLVLIFFFVDRMLGEKKLLEIISTLGRNVP